MGGNAIRTDYLSILGAEAEVRRAEAAAEQAAALRRQAADAEATRYLAEMACPPDVVDFGQRHAIPAFAAFTWQAGFMAGWRAAQTRKADGTPERTALPHEV